jgi:hypothetical protein
LRDDCMTCFYLLGWRRLSGCAFALLAMVCLTMWMRSYMLWDMITMYPKPGTSTELKSDRGSFGWERATGVDSEYLHMEWISGRHMPDFALFAYVLNRRHSSIVLQINCAGVSVGRSLDPPFEFVVLPYWLVTMPLACVASILILWVPRRLSSGSGPATPVKRMITIDPEHGK